VPSAAAGTAVSNYAVSYANGKFTVTPEAITITANNQTKVYGQVFTFAGTEFKVTTGQLYNGDVLTATIASAGAPITATVAGSTYDITPSAAAGTAVSNYAVSYANGKFTVTPETITITANDQTKVYGQVFTFAGTEFKVTTGQLYNGDVLTATITSTGAPITATVAGSTYPIVPSAAAGTAVSNYAVSYANGKFTVTPEAITITANDQTKVYGQVFTFAGTEFKVTTGQLYNGDVLTATIASTGAPITATVAGSTYPIIPSAAAGTALSNYTVSYANGKFTVTPEPITITANDQTKVYGQVFTFAGTEFKVTTGQLYNGDVLTATIASAGAPITATVAGSTYDITPSAAAGTAVSNYTVSYANGKFTVTPEAITITANNQTKVYGQVFTFAGTEFTVTTGQLYNNDVLTVTLTSAGAAQGATVPGSPYAIIPSAAAGTALGNYTVGYANGLMTVTPFQTCASYNGVSFANTDVGSNTTASNVVLSVAVTTPYNNTGGVNATVKFSIDGGTSYSNAIFVKYDSTARVSVYSYTVPTITLPSNAVSYIYPVSWVIGGNYSNGQCAETAADLTISIRSTDFVTGGGYIVLNSSGSGAYKGDVGTKTNFGFNVKWSKTLNNIQGSGFNAIIRGTDPVSGAKVLYQIKGTKATALQVVPGTTANPVATATFVCNATWLEYNEAGTTLLTSVGNYVVTVQMTDNCDPGPGNSASTDQINIMLKDNYGKLVYTNSLSGTTFVQQTISGGNLEVHGDAGTPSAPTCSSPSKTVMLQVPSLQFKDDQAALSATIYPNPSPSNFKLQLSGGTSDKVEVIVSDILGHVMETRQSPTGTTFTLGNNLRTGMYLIQLRQGQTYKFYRIYKQ
jgi:hypothetical protein